MTTAKKPRVPPTTEKAKVAVAYTITAEGAQALLAYLAQRPYHEVQDLCPVLLSAEPVWR